MQNGHDTMWLYTKRANIKRFDPKPRGSKRLNFE